MLTCRTKASWETSQHVPTAQKNVEKRQSVMRGCISNKQQLDVISSSHSFFIDMPVSQCSPSTYSHFPTQMIRFQLDRYGMSGKDKSGFEAGTVLLGPQYSECTVKPFRYLV